MTPKTHYEILGVSRSFTEGELTEAWRTLSRTHHPDRGGNADEFAEISRAYAVLRNSKSRVEYDAALSLCSEPCSKCKGAGRTYKQKGFGGRVASTCEACNGSGRAAPRTRK